MRDLIFRFFFIVSSLSVVTGIVGILIPLEIDYKEYFLPSLLLLPFILKKNNDSITYFEIKLTCIILLIQIWGLIIFYYQNNYISFLSLATFFSTLIWLVIWFKSEKHHNLIFIYYLNIIKTVIISSFIVYIFDITNLIDIRSYSLPKYFDMGFKNKYLIEGNNDVYGVVGNYIVIMKNYIKPIPVLENIGTYCGISYEPHLFTFTTTPALIIFLKQKKYIWFALTLFLILLSFSVTNILALLISLTILLNKKTVIVFSAIVTFFGLKYLDLILESSKLIIWVSDKFNSRSNDDINNTFKYIFNLKDFIGSGIYPSERLDNGIGMISGLLVLAFFLSIIFEIFKKIKSNKISAVILTYILIHSLKFPINIFYQPFVLFITFIIIKYDGFLRNNI